MSEFPPTPDASSSSSSCSCSNPSGDREALRRRLEEWLNETLSDETPPEGLDAELVAELTDAHVGASPSSGAAGAQTAGEAKPPLPGCDRYALWSALTALKQEIGLQGRTFGRLDETLSPLASIEPAARELNAAVGDLLDRAGTRIDREIREAADDARREAERRLLAPLLETRERLGRNLASLEEALDRQAAAPRRRWFGFGGAERTRREDAIEETEALREGCAMSLARLEDTLTELGVQVIERPGVPFDPRYMQAVEITPTDEADDGMVLEIIRPGYVWRGEIIRPALTRVAKSRIYP